MENKPSDEILKKLSEVAKIFPEGFVIFLPPAQEKSTWISVFRWNPKCLKLLEAVYDKIVGGHMASGSSN